MDPVCQPARLFERLLHVPTQVTEARPCGLGIDAEHLAEELELDGERDELLLDAAMQLALECAKIGVRGEHEPFARRAQPRDLRAQLRERLVLRHVASLHRSGLQVDGFREVVRHPCGGVKRPSMRGTAEASLLPICLLPPWPSRTRRPSLVMCPDGNQGRGAPCIS